MKNIVTILGARPQFIKASVVSKAISKMEGMRECVIHTGQHHDQNMSDVFFTELDMQQPKYSLRISGGSHGLMTGRMLQAIEQVLLEERPDMVLVYGDTNSTLAGALAAVKLQIPVAHVEAGLRSFNMRMPEEVNRILTDRVSRLLFTPTATAVDNLEREGVDNQSIIPVGDVMYDVALQAGARVSSEGGILDRLKVGTKGYVLATLHRAENTDDPARLETILAALGIVSDFMPVICPLHPRVRAILEKHNRLSEVGRKLKLIEPVGYLDMVQLEKFAAVIATDSGGVQKEAFFHRVPCVTMRDETEWVELLTAGWNRLASPKNAMELAMKIKEAIGSRGGEVHPYGKGDAAKLIADHLTHL